MKRLLLLLIVPLMFACSSDNKESEPEPTQDYTSFVFVNKTEAGTPPTITNCVVGYYEDGLCKKIAELGDLFPGKTSKEIKVENKNIKIVYLFSDYPYSATKSLKDFVLEPNKKNTFALDDNIKGERVDPNDPTQYPH